MSNGREIRAEPEVQNDGGGLDVIPVIETGDPRDVKPFWVTIHEPELVDSDVDSGVTAGYGLATFLVSAPGPREAVEAAIEGVSELLGFNNLTGELVAIKEIDPGKAKNLIRILSRALE